MSTHLTAWWNQPFRMYQTNLAEIDAGLDVAATLDRIEEHGADVWLLNAGGILAFHPTDRPDQRRNPHLADRPGHDLLGEAVAAAHDRGVRLIGRLDFSKVQREIAEQHPEWCFVGPRGHWQEYQGLVSVCPSGDYYQQRSLDIIDELLDRYPLDGFFLNWLSFNEADYSRVYHGVCHCTACAGGFAEYAPGCQLPTGPDSPDYATWKAFAAGVIDRLTARIHGHIRARDKNVALILGSNADILFFEANNALGRQLPLWIHGTGEAVSRWRSIHPDKPVVVNAAAFVDMPYRLASEEPEHYALYQAQAVARGANPSTYLMGEPGRLVNAAAAEGSRFARFHRDHAELYTGLTSRAAVALVKPAFHGWHDDGWDSPAEREYRGCYLALLSEHVPFDVVAEEALPGLLGTPERAARYRVLLLPETPLREPGVRALVDAFAAAGGTVVATGDVAPAGGDQMGLTCLGVEAVTGVRQGTEGMFGCYLADGTDTADLTSGRVVYPLHDQFRHTRLRPGATGRLRLLSQAPYGPPEKCHGHIPLDHVGVVHHTHGAGRTVYFPWPVGRGHVDFGLSRFGTLIADTIRETTPDAVPLRTTGLPEAVELILSATGDGRTLLQLINYTGQSDRRFRAPVTVHGARVHFPGDPAYRTATALVAGADAALTEEGGEQVLTLPELGLFEAIVLA
ncbi:alpha-amylase family protein [Streptomyces millisiae]|uniref:Beta-galactosidase trimerisation domain-containing protein n=1 Tax=Streptomyces millisiae TaxID=3075542 RepID=A0ABU2LHA3_9ACTN|nr:hypothetical protein [Streptomyces sp. DSM 44918]MDT0316964.1 hypothetical protein [Streptomyces sp. DSM 44918]